MAQSKKDALDALVKPVEEPIVPKPAAAEPPAQPEPPKTGDDLLNTEPKVTPPVDPPQTFDQWEFLSETLGRTVTSKEDLIVEKEVEKVIEKPREYISEFSKNYDAFFKDTNRPIEDFLIVTRDVNAMDEDQVLRENLKLKTPGLSTQDVDFMLRKKYSTTEEMTADEKYAVELQKKVDIGEARRTLLDLKDKYSVPEENTIASFEQKQQATQDKLEQDRLDWINSIQQTNSSISEIEIEIPTEEGKDPFKYKHSIPDNARNSVKDIASDNTMSKWLQRYLKEDGSIDPVKLQLDLYKRDNFDAIVKEAVAQARADERELIIKEDKNIQFQTRRPAANTGDLSQKAKQEQDLLNKRRS